MGLIMPNTCGSRRYARGRQSTLLGRLLTRVARSHGGFIREQLVAKALKFAVARLFAAACCLSDLEYAIVRHFRCSSGEMADMALCEQDLDARWDRSAGVLINEPFQPGVFVGKCRRARCKAREGGWCST